MSSRHFADVDWVQLDKVSILETQAVVVIFVGQSVLGVEVAWVDKVYRGLVV